MPEISPWNELTDLRHELLNVRQVIKGMSKNCKKESCSEKEFSLRMLKSMDYHMQKIYDLLNSIADKVEE